MLKKINLQYLISYLGACPFIIIIFDKFFLHQLDPYIIKNFIIYYSIIIFVFIGSLNWNLKENLSIKIVLFGFFPSFFSVFIIILNLYSYDVLLLFVLLFIMQLFLDIFVYKKNQERKIYYFLRLPLTLIIIISLIIILL